MKAYMKKVQKQLLFIAFLTLVISLSVTAFGDEKKKKMPKKRDDTYCLLTKNNDGCEDIYDLKLTNVSSVEPLVLVFDEGVYKVLNISESDTFKIVGTSKNDGGNALIPFDYTYNEGVVVMDNSFEINFIDAAVTEHEFSVYTDETVPQNIYLVPHSEVQSCANIESGGDVLIHIAKMLDPSYCNRDKLPSQKYICHLQNHQFKGEKVKTYYVVPMYSSKMDRPVNEKQIQRLKKGSIKESTKQMKIRQKASSDKSITLSWDNLYDVARYYVYSSMFKGTLKLVGKADAIENDNGVMKFTHNVETAGWYRYIIVAVNGQNKTLCVSKTFYGHTKYVNRKNPFKK